MCFVFVFIDLSVKNCNVYMLALTGTGTCILHYYFFYVIYMLVVGNENIFRPSLLYYILNKNSLVHKSELTFIEFMHTMYTYYRKVNSYWRILNYYMFIVQWHWSTVNMCLHIFFLNFITLKHQFFIAKHRRNPNFSTGASFCNIVHYSSLYHNYSTRYLTLKLFPTESWLYSGLPL